MMIYQTLAKVFLIRSIGRCCQLPPITRRPGEGRDPYPFAGQGQPVPIDGTYYVYILASRRYGTRYIGVTNNVHARLEQHRTGRGSIFVRQYAVYPLVHVEEFASPLEAISREKQLKNWRRDWKIRLVEEANPDWSDLSHLLQAAVGMGPGLRRDDQEPDHRHRPHIADSSLSPQ